MIDNRLLILLQLHGGRVCPLPSKFKFNTVVTLDLDFFSCWNVKFPINNMLMQRISHFDESPTALQHIRMMLFQLTAELLLNHLHLIKVLAKLANQLGILLRFHEVLNQLINATVNSVRQPLAPFQLRLVLTAFTEDVCRKVQLYRFGGEHFELYLIIQNGLDLRGLLIY